MIYAHFLQANFDSIGFRFCDQAQEMKKIFTFSRINHIFALEF